MPQEVFVRKHDTSVCVCACGVAGEGIAAADICLPDDSARFCKWHLFQWDLPSRHRG